MGLAKHSAQILATKLLVFVLITATAVVNNRLLGPAGKGQYAIALLVTATLAVITSMGLTVAFQYFINKRDEQAAKFVGFSLVVAVVLGGFYGLLVWMFRGFLQDTVLKHVPDLALIVSILSVPLAVLCVHLLPSIFMARLRVIHFNSVYVIQAALLFIFSVVFVWWLRLGVNGAVAGYGLSLLVTTVIALSWAIRFEGVSFNFRGGLIRQSLGFSWKSFLSQVAMRLQNRAGFYMVNLLLPSSAMVGLYSVGAQYCELLLYIPESVRGTMLARISADADYGDRTTAMASRQVLILTGLAAAVAFFAARPLIVIMFGIEFAGAVSPLRLLLPGVIMLGVCNVIYVDLAGRGKPQYTAVSSGLGLVLTIVFDIILIPRMGINGAAVASSIAYTVAALTAMRFFASLSGQRTLAPLALGKEDIALTASYVAKVFKKAAGLPFSAHKPA